MNRPEEDIQEIIKLNRQRNAALDSEYNPVNGKGSPIKRVKLWRDGRTYILIPLEMAEDPAVKLVLAAGSVKAVCAKYKDTIPLMTPNLLWDELLEKRLDYDFEYWAFTAIKIQDKESKQPIPFKLRPAQRKLLYELESMRLAGVPIRAILLKARQWGGSTLIQLYMLWLQSRRRKNWHSVIVTDVEDQARTVRSHTSRAIKNYPKFLGKLDLSPFEGSSKNKIIPSRGCVISIGSMQEPDSLRSNDFAMMHLSEVGLWKATEGKKPEDLVQALRGALASVPDSLAVLESTAKGVGNFFHREWEAAERKESAYKPIFIPWFDIEMYRKPLTESVEEFVSGMNEYDKFLWKIGATLEGINWYNSFKAGERYDEWRMKSEFPSTAQEAFQSTGSRVFRIEDVLKARANTIAPKLIGDLFASQQKGAGALDRINFGASPEGNLSVWELPDKTIKVKNRYCVFMDIGGTTKKADWTVIKAVDRYWMIDGGRPETVAVWRGHIDTDLAAWKAAQIASWYDDALLAVEVNSIKKRKGDDPDKSLTVLDEIMEYYPNLYMRTKIDSITKEESKVPGFHTNVSTKGMIIDCLIAATRDEEYIERDVRACDEMDYYEKKPDGSMGAVDGKNDDHVIVSAGCAWLALKYMERPTLIANTQQTNRTQAQGMASF